MPRSARTSFLFDLFSTDRLDTFLSDQSKLVCAFGRVDEADQGRCVSQFQVTIVVNSS